MPDHTDPSELVVDDASVLREVCRDLRAAGAFGFDTEFIRERSYRPQLCLVQVASRDFAAVIDPLKVEIDEFWRLVQDDEVQKVVHGSQQDLEMCYLSTGRLPANIFDVQIAAGLTGLPYPISYGGLVQKILHVKIVQDATFSEWAQRPLTESQLRYATDDVVHLVPLKEKLQRRLDKLGRKAWMAEEMQKLLAAGRYADQGRDLWQRVRGWKQLGRRGLAVLRELAAWRERAAEEADVPPRTLLRDEVLTLVARQKPQTMSQLKSVRGFPRPLAARAGTHVLGAVKEACEVPKARLPQAARLWEDSPATNMLTHLASAIGESLCLSGGLSHQLMAGRSDYAALVRTMRRKGAKLEHLKLMTGWRKEFAGLAIEQALAGSRKIRVKSLTKDPGLELE